MLIDLCVLLCLTGTSLTRALEFTTKHCAEGDGASYIGPHYTVIDSTNEYTPCQVMTDLKLPMTYDYTIEVEFNANTALGPPGLMINVDDDNTYDVIIFRTDMGWTAEKASMVNGEFMSPSQFFGYGLQAVDWFYVKLNVQKAFVDVQINNDETFTVPLTSQQNPSVGLMHVMTYKTLCQPNCEFEFRNLKLTPVSDTPHESYNTKFGTLVTPDFLVDNLHVHTLEFSQLGHVHGTYCFVALYFKHIDIGPGTIYVENDSAFTNGSLKLYSTTADRLGVYFYSSSIGSQPTGYTIDYHVFACGVPDSDLSFVCEDGNYNDRHADYFRSTSHETDLTNSDTDLIMGWYKFSSCAGDTIPNTRPAVEGVCGTQRPIWLQEPANGIDEIGLSEAISCVSTIENECAYSWVILVYRCEIDSHLYYLLPTPVNSGYCVGTKTRCEASQNLTSIDGSGCSPCVEADFPMFNEPPTFDSWQLDATTPRMFRLTCAVHDPDGTTVEIEYEIEWYIQYGNHRSLLTHYMTDEPSVTYIKSTQLQKSHLQNYIICKVRGKYTQGIRWGPWTESIPLFIGIQVVNSEQNLNTKLPAKSIDFIITVPFSCNGENCMDVEDPNCSTEVYIVYETSSLTRNWRCTNEMYDEPVMINLDCSMKVSCSEWGTVINKRNIIQKKTLTKLVNSQTVYLVLKDTRDMWNNLLTSVKINMDTYEEAQSVATCKSYNDPHITTFAGVQYDAHDAGEYVLYKSKPIAEMEMEVLVTALFEQCANNPDIMCNRKLGVRVQNEVVIIDPQGTPLLTYHGNYTITDGFKVTLINDGSGYKIDLPRGEEITAILNWGNKYLNLEILGNLENQYPGGSGLCGKVVDLVDNNNDLCFRNNSQHPLPSTPFANTPTFYSDWRVNSSLKEDIITRHVHESKTYSPGPVFYSCSVGYINGFLQADEWSFKRDLVKEQCKPYGDYNLLTDLRQSANEQVSAKQYPNGNLLKRPYIKNTVVNLKSDWTEESAKAYCHSYIAESSTGKACSGIKLKDVEEAAHQCAIDIMLTGGTEWAIGTLSSLRQSCTDAVYRNLSLWTIDKSGNDTVITPPLALMDNLCPADCSGNGVCRESVCVCNEGFIGYDCSLTVETAPEVIGLLDGAICNTETCNSISVLGNKFVNGDKLTCHYATEDSTISVSGRMVSHNLITCALPATAFSKSGYIKFTVLVSNDGLHTGEALGLVLVNSPCVTCDETPDSDVTCHVKNNMCLIDGQCVPSGDVSAADVCSFCNPEDDQDTWSLQRGCGDTGANPGLQPLHIGLIAVGSVLVAIGLIVGSIAISKRSQRKVTPRN